jgi:hypothetical protein
MSFNLQCNPFACGLTNTVKLKITL